MAIDLELVRFALETARRHRIRELELRQGEDRFNAVLSKSTSRRHLCPSQAIPSTMPMRSETLVISAPIVGYFRETTKKLAVGAHVTVGEVVAAVAALGIANEVEAPASGTIVEVLVRPDDAVEFGQPLARMRTE